MCKNYKNGSIEVQRISKEKDNGKKWKQVLKWYVHLDFFFFFGNKEIEF